MPDPTAIIGAIAACVSLTKKICDYTSSFKNAPKCVADLRAEATAVGTNMDMLRKHLEHENNKSTAFERTSALFFATDGCNKRLQEIGDILAPLMSGSKTSRFLQRLKWPLDEEDTIQEVKALHRYAQLFHFALTIDGFAILSGSQSSALVEIQTKLDSVLESAETRSDAILAGIRDVLEAVKDLPQLNSAMEEISVKVDDLILRANNTENYRRKDEIEADRKILLDSLPSLPFEDKHRDLQHRRTPGLGRWILDVPNFKSLYQGTLENNTLWCHGVPGAGKTFLTSLVIDYLESEYPKENLRLAYFYFDYREQSTQTPFKFVACLLKQVVSLCHDIPAAASGVCRRLRDNKPLPSWEELAQILVAICNDMHDLFLVFDALDECDENTNRESILRILDSLVSSPVKIFATSRPQCLDIKATFGVCPQVTIEATEADIQDFVIRKISESRRMAAILQGALYDQVIHTIVEKSQGMFLLPALQIGNILSQTNEKEVRQALQELPSGLVRNLDLAIERIKHQEIHSTSRARRAMQTLLWLCYSKRNLTSIELQHALALSSGMRLFDPTAVTRVDLLIESCLGLVTIDEETSIVSLVHLSVNEYLHEQSAKLFPDSHAKLAIDCLTYILLDDFKTPLPSTEKELKGVMEMYPFLDYASTCWGQHAAEIFNAEVEALTSMFISQTALLERWSQLIEWKDSESRYHCFSYKSQKRSNLSTFIVRNISLFHIAARYGIDKLLHDHSQVSYPDLNSRDSLYRTPLMLAATHGHAAFVRTLLSWTGTEANLCDSNGDTALKLAVRNQQFEIVQILLSCPKINPNLGQPFFHIPDLWNTPGNRGKMFAELFLLNPNFDVNDTSEDKTNQYGRRVWVLLAIYFQFGPLKSLLSRGDFNLARGKVRLEEELKFVCEFNFHTDYLTAEEQVSRILVLDMLEKDPRFPMPDYATLKGIWPILFYIHSWGPRNPEKESTEILGHSIFDCSEQHRKKILTNLEAYDITLDMKDSHGRGYLQYAAKISNEEHVRFLLENGADPSTGDDSGITPLHLAAEGGSESIVTLLLASGASICAVDNEGRSPLYCALKRGYESLAHLLLSQGADASTSKRNGYTALHYAAANGLERVFMKLLELGANAAAADENGWTVMHSAADCEHDVALQVVQTLHLRQAAVDDATAEGVTALHVAAESGRVEVLEYLLRNGANPNALSLKGTPLHLATESMDKGKIRALLKHGGDVNLLDCYGRSSRERISSLLPLLSLPPLQPRSTKEVMNHLLTCLRDRVAITLLKSEESSREMYLARLGRQLLELGDHEAAIVSFGIEFWYTKRKPWTPNWNATCSECDSYSDPAGRFVCKRCLCANAIFCSECVVKARKTKFPWCRDHEMIQVPVERWENLPEGIVNEKGQNFDEWLRSIEKKYTASNEDVCFTCDRKERVGGQTLLRCGRCKVASYCSKECQVKDWMEGGHKRICRTLVVKGSNEL